jgi:hypothetical protein
VVGTWPVYMITRLRWGSALAVAARQTASDAARRPSGPQLRPGPRAGWRRRLQALPARRLPHQHDAGKRNAVTLRWLSPQRRCRDGPGSGRHAAPNRAARRYAWRRSCSWEAARWSSPEMR